MFNAS